MIASGCHADRDSALVCSPVNQDLAGVKADVLIPVNSLTDKEVLPAAVHGIAVIELQERSDCSSHRKPALRRAFDDLAKVFNV